MMMIHIRLNVRCITIRTYYTSRLRLLLNDVNVTTMYITII